MSGDLDRRLAALAHAAELADGRLEQPPVEAARNVIRRAGERMGLGMEATVVALAGPTGAGKSTLFNALTGVDLVATSPRRPTTSRATGVVWGESPDALLDWLEVRLRHTAPPDPRRNGLVLLDLPDFDSVEEAHGLEVDRLVALVDLLVWIVDPQKYADAALHDRYLRRLGHYQTAMLVVLNQVDLLSPDAQRACVRDLRGLLAADGLPEAPVLAVSARTGQGLEELGRVLEERVSEHGAALARLSADVTTVALGLDAGCGSGRAADISRRDRDQLVRALGDAAGVPTVVDAVDRSHRREGALATGWPLVRWVGRLRPDPLRRLRLGAPTDEATRTSLPVPTPVQRSAASSALRSLGATAAGTLPDPWPRLVRDAAVRHEAELPDRLDRAVAGAELPRRRPRWWGPAGSLQTLFALVALLGAVWLLVLAALGYLRLNDVLPVPEWRGVALPTLLLIGGLALGIGLGAVFRVVNRAGARRRATRASRSLGSRIERLAEELVMAPVDQELRAREDLCAALAEAAKAGARSRRSSGRRRG